MKSSDGGKTCAMLLCAGTGSRTKLAYNKILHYIGKKTVLELTLDAFEKSDASDLLLVINPSDEVAIRELAAPYKNVRFTHGGNTRTESVRRGLEAIGESEFVAIHDGARPFVSPALINATIESAKKYGSGIAAVRSTDTVKEAENGTFIKSLSREKLWNVQTPQTFSLEQIKKAYNDINGDYTDDSEVYSLAGFSPKIVEGEYGNVKITTESDLYGFMPSTARIGTGFDVHELVTGRPLVLGGITVPHNKGLSGHSDADALAHAIMDALLSAAGLQDIGVLFPDTDKSTEGISSMLLLERVNEKIRAAGYEVGNISSVIMAQKPKLATHIQSMRQNLANELKIELSKINISATTTEHLGIIGEEKGIAASAVCILTRSKHESGK